MSRRGNFGGRTSVASRSSPLGVLAPLSRSEVGQPPCPCIAGTLTDATAYSSTATGGLGSPTPYPFNGNVLPASCSFDMRVEVTVDAYSADSDQAYFFVGARQQANSGVLAGGGIAISSLHGVWFGAIEESPFGTANALWGVYAPYVDVGVTNLATEILTTQPQPGDVLELTVVGTTAVCKRNGSTMFSVTVTDPGPGSDSPPHGGMFNTYVYNGTVTGSGLEVETLCP